MILEIEKNYITICGKLTCKPLLTCCTTGHEENEWSKDMCESRMVTPLRPIKGFAPVTYE
jgi:hypothetical protein